MPENRYDLMILGSGPAGLTAAIYGQRLGLNVIVFGDTPDGSTYMIENLANFPGAGIEVSSMAGNDRQLAIDGIFLSIGWRPNTKMLALPVKKTEEGYLMIDQKLMTSFPGLFAAGDVRETDMWQVLTAYADGARAAKYAAEYVERYPK